MIKTIELQSIIDIQELSSTRFSIIVPHRVHTFDATCPESKQVWVEALHCIKQIYQHLLIQTQLQEATKLASAHLEIQQIASEFYNEEKNKQSKLKARNERNEAHRQIIRDKYQLPHTA